MPRKQHGSPGQILLFPPLPPERRPANATATPALPAGTGPRAVALPPIVVSGSFRKDLPALAAEFDELKSLGFEILSPANIRPVAEADGFVFMEGETGSSPEAVELRHLDALRRAGIVWLHAPEGYLGPSAALEIGFANALGIPVFSSAPLSEPVLRQFVLSVNSPRQLADSLKKHPAPPIPAVQPFQAYYARAAVRRGYASERPEDTLLLMIEEFGELAHAIRKRSGLKREGLFRDSEEQQELADIFIYVVHMANVLGVDLASAVESKELSNIKRFLAR